MTPDSLQRLRRIRWAPGGRGPDVADCIGFVLLYCAEAGIPLPEPDCKTPEGDARAACTAEIAALLDPMPRQLADAAGHAVLFANAQGVLMHVGVVTPDGRLMHCTFGGVRLDRSTELLARVGLYAVGCVPLGDAVRLGKILSLPSLRDPATIILGILAVISIVLSVVLMPNLAAYGANRGRYGFDGLVTQNTAEIAIPDVLGKVWCAGNIVYQALTDKTGAVTDPAEQKTVALVVFCAGPVEGIGTLNLRINGNTWDSNVWYSHTRITPPSYTVTGFYFDLGGLNLTTRAEVWDGTIAADPDRPSITMRTAELDIPGSRPEIVPVDLRAGYDRNFPLYGLNGCVYGVFRLVDSRKYSQFNVVALIQGRKFRLFDDAGWLTTTVTDEDQGALWDGSRKYAVLAHPDVSVVTTVKVNGTTYTEMDATHQSGNVYRVNYRRGYIEFLTAPAAAATVLVTYTYYQQDWRTTPTHHILHLLTDPEFGRGMDDSKIDWPSFDAAQDYYVETVSTQTPSGVVSDTRYSTNYMVDRRRPALDHLQALLDACTSTLLLTDGKLKLKPITNSASVYSFDADSILRDSFKVTFTDRAEAANRLKVVFNDVANFSAQTAVIVEDLSDQDARRDAGLEPVVEKALHFPAVTAWAQAHRLGMQRLAIELGRTWSVEFTTNIIGLAIEPGDTIDLTHPAMPSWAGELARVDEVSHDDKDRLVIKASQYVELPYA